MEENICKSYPEGKKCLQLHSKYQFEKDKNIFIDTSPKEIKDAQICIPDDA